MNKQVITTLLISTIIVVLLLIKIYVLTSKEEILKMDVSYLKRQNILERKRSDYWYKKDSTDLENFNKHLIEDIKFIKFNTKIIKLANQSISK